MPLSAEVLRRASPSRFSQVRPDRCESVSSSRVRPIQRKNSKPSLGDRNASLAAMVERWLPGEQAKPQRGSEIARARKGRAESSKQSG